MLLWTLAFTTAVGIITSCGLISELHFVRGQQIAKDYHEITAIRISAYGIVRTPQKFRGPRWGWKHYPQATPCTKAEAQWLDAQVQKFNWSQEDAPHQDSHLRGEEPHR